EEVGGDPEEQGAQVQPGGGGVLVVPAPPRVEPAGHVLAQAAAEEVLDLDQVGARPGVPREAIGGEVEDLEEPPQECRASVAADDAGLGQHHRVGEVHQRVLAESPAQVAELRRLVVLHQHRAPGAEARLLEKQILLRHARRPPGQPRYTAEGTASAGSGIGAGVASLYTAATLARKAPPRSGTTRGRSAAVTARVAARCR